MFSRRRFLAGLAAPALASLHPLRSAAAEVWQPAELPEGAVAEGHLEAIAGKVPLIKRSYRPPNFETPVDFFRDPITRNDAFFVRYHLASIPQVDARAWRLKVGGEAARQGLELTLAQLLKDFAPIDLVAVCQCSGNRRGMFAPHVQGVEWGVGAMGNARWTGVRLRDVLQKAGVDDKAVEIALDGADGTAVEDPDFIRACQSTALPTPRSSPTS
jgi:DMSO/TMAO reductase YedYZ molybdopterin-dependent catalytic subunit